MKTTIDIPKELIDDAIEFSGAKTRREAICWALKKAVDRQAIEDLISQKVKIEFRDDHDPFKKPEAQNGKKRRRRR